MAASVQPLTGGGSNAYASICLGRVWSVTAPADLLEHALACFSSQLDLCYAGITSCEPFFANINARNFAGFVVLAFRLTSCVLPGGS